MSETLISPSVDSWVDQTLPGANRPATPKLRLHGSGSANQQRAFIFFAKPFPFGATVFEGILRLKIAGAWSGTHTITAKRVTEQWREGHITWDNQPAVTATNSASVSVTDAADGDEVEIDLTAMLNDVAGGGAWFGIRLELGSDAARTVYSSDSAVERYRPSLTVDWREPPEAPTNLVPSGGQAVGPAKPVLSWQFAEPGTDAEQAQAASQVQISTSTDFSSPGYDSGKVANTESLWDMSTESYSLSALDVRYWRVRVWDDADLVSEWSAPQQFTRIGKGTLTLDNPPASPAEVDETTPPIAWTYTGDQESYEIVLFRLRADGSTTFLEKIPRTVSTDTSHTLPNGLLRSGRTYRVRLRVWDTEDRPNIVGDAPYAQVIRDFTYERDGTPDPVTALTATADGPKIELAWTRAAMPDYFALVVDGEEVLDRIDPDEVHVSGTSYAMDYWGAAPGVEHTFELEGVVTMGGKLLHSDGNATDEATPSSRGGIWLVDPEDSTYVWIAGQPSVDMQIREVAETHDVFGSRRPVRITSTLGGYAGSISGGQLIDSDERTAITERDAFLELKGRLTELRLILSDLNLPVILEDSNPTPTPAPGDQLYELSFAWFQSGEFEDTFEIAGG